MIKKINKNILWTELFADELAAQGIKYACISPGSRSTPLTLAFVNHKKIKTFVHIDERSGAFFALGLAKASGFPVALISTSGTATAELYPAIIEAYQQRIPLIICTADRPPEMLDSGANQTINQNNLYKNHIRWFCDVGLPELNPRRLKHICVIARRAAAESALRSRGPVHLNFPFRKPFEPKSYTDEIDEKFYRSIKSESILKVNHVNSGGSSFHEEKWFRQIIKQLKSSERGLIIAGPENYYPGFHKACSTLAEYLGYPILADASSQLRFGSLSRDNVIINFDSFFRSSSFTKKINPDIVLHFGRTITSKALDNFLESTAARRYMINEFGDWFDPSNKSFGAFTCKPFLFCNSVLDKLNKDKFKRQSNDWLMNFIKADKAAQAHKEKIINSSAFPNEARIIDEILELIPENSQLMISNSMPIRDFDFFASGKEKNITIFNNRGASGIDGITSTALGIAAANSLPTILLTGDLAFYHDMNGLLAAGRYKIPLVIILINNNGGGIFGFLPIAEYKKVFNEFFITPHNLNFSNFVRSYSGKYKLIKSWEDFRSSFKGALKGKNFTVLEIRTDAEKSLQLRRKYWKAVEENLT